jgi:TatD DNase family protein
MLIDSHSHLNFQQFAKDSKETIKRALDNDTRLIIVGSQYSTSKRAIEIAESYESMVYAAVGLHPIHLEFQEYEDTIDGEKIVFHTRAEEFDEKKYKELARNEKVVAIGETGLDYYHVEQKNKDKLLAKQIQVLKQHIKVAIEADKPVIFHCRDAYNELAEVLSRYSDLYGVVHCFSSNWEIAKQMLNKGLYLGFTGIITFKNKSLDSLREVVKKTPIDKILIETDCPYLSPEPFRGKRNEPLYVQYIAKKIAEIKEISYDEACEQTSLNAKQLFKI